LTDEKKYSGVLILTKCETMITVIVFLHHRFVRDERRNANRVTPVRRHDNGSR